MIEKMRKELKALEELMNNRQAVADNLAFRIDNLLGENSRLQQALTERKERLAKTERQLAEAVCKIDTLEEEKENILKQRVGITQEEQDMVVDTHGFTLSGLREDLNRLKAETTKEISDLHGEFGEHLMNLHSIKTTVTELQDAVSKLNVRLS